MLLDYLMLKRGRNVCNAKTENVSMSFAQQRAQFHPWTQDVTERMSVTPAKVSPTAPPTKK